jgi:hypothetical protein
LIRTVGRFAVALPLSVYVAAFVLGPCSPRPLAAAEMRNRAMLGYDTFIDRFTLLEQDTLDAVQEFYLGLASALSFGGENARGGASNLFKIGNQTIDENLDVETGSAPGYSGFDFRGNLRWKHFQPGSDYEFGNDYVQTNAFLRFRRKLNEGLRLNVKGRVETVDYKQRTTFDYDYRYGDGGIELQGGSDFDRSILVGGYIGFKDAPDTTALGYRRTLAELETRLASPRGLAFHLASVGDRKDYRESIRSSYWSVISFLDFDMSVGSGMVWSLKGESELTVFDRPDTIFFDTHFLRGGVKCRYAIGATSGVFVEPRYARMICGDFPEERYWEGSAIFGVDFLRNGDFWVNASYEPGYRDYTLDENNIYSDFSFHRVSLMASFPFPAGTTLSLFATHDPERHSRRDDDFSVTLVSAELTKGF